MAGGTPPIDEPEHVPVEHVVVAGGVTCRISRPILEAVRRVAGMLGFLLALWACDRAATPGVVAPEPRESEPDAPASAEAPTPAAEDEPIDVASAAAGNELVFMHVRDGCEAWQFMDNGARLGWLSDDDSAPRLSYRVSVGDPGELALTEPRAEAMGETLELDCAEEGQNENVLYLHETDCRAGIRPIVIRQGCPTILLSKKNREAFRQRLASQRKATILALQEQAPQLLRKFKESLGRHSRVYWRETADDGGSHCVEWKARKRQLVRSFENGGKTTYGYDLKVDARSGLAVIELSGPSYTGPNGNIGMGSLDAKTIESVDEHSAVVDGVRWFFRREACDSATQEET